MRSTVRFCVAPLEGPRKGAFVVPRSASGPRVVETSLRRTSVRARRSVRRGFPVRLRGDPVVAAGDECVFCIPLTVYVDSSTRASRRSVERHDSRFDRHVSVEVRVER